MNKKKVGGSRDISPRNVRHKFLIRTREKRRLQILPKDCLSTCPLSTYCVKVRCKTKMQLSCDLKGEDKTCL